MPIDRLPSVIDDLSTRLRGRSARSSGSVPASGARARPKLAAGVLIALLVLCDPAGARPSGGENIMFQTRDGAGNALWLRGVLWSPARPPKAAVVLVHGSGGWSDHREGHYGRALSVAGYAVLAIDSFGARGIRQTIDDQSQISALQMARDAFAARRYLIEHGLPPRRMAIMGFSKGGMAALFAADRNFLPTETDRFQAAVPFYPGCNIIPRRAKPASTVFMALGERDDYTGVRTCQEIAEGYARAGGKISVKVYAGAAHAFDGNPANMETIHLQSAETFIDCVVRVDEDGQASFAGRRYALNDMALGDALRASCVRRGASVAANPEQKERATRDVIEFLDAAFAD